MKYTTLLFDVDDTLLDFRAAERRALDVTFTKFAPGSGDGIKNAYHEINGRLWRDYELGLIPREDIYRRRFPDTFRACSLPSPGNNIVDFYQDALSEGHALMPGAVETLDALFGRFSLRLITNGKKTTQLRRLNDSGLIKYFDGIFISEDLKAQKPSREFFDKVFEVTGDERDSSLIIGDSLSSDIQGGFNAGIDTCWFNPNGAECRGRQPDYEIRCLTELPEMLLSF